MTMYKLEDTPWHAMEDLPFDQSVKDPIEVRYSHFRTGILTPASVAKENPGVWKEILKDVRFWRYVPQMIKVD